ncbi:MAG: ArsR/SmtB family transcription factor [Poseidonia sp.]
MADIDQALYLLQNKTRRQILERLAREPHYPMQLSELIGVSQPAVVKHLKELEKGGMVSKNKVPSEKGGPPRTIYAVERAMSIHVDIGPDLFRCEERKLPAGGPMRLSSNLPAASVPIAESLSGRKKIAVAEGLAHMRSLANVLEELDAQRDALISLHQHVRQRVSAAVEADFDSYQERSIIQSMVEATGDRIDLTALVQQELAGHTNVGEVITALRSRLEKQIARRSGQVIAAPLDTELRWYLGPRTK